MSKLQKARLQEVSSDESEKPLGPPIDVQFNPTTLRLQMSNSVEGGESRGRPARQYLGSNSTVLSLELIFDTADEGSTDRPRSVREKTAAVEKFVLPRVEGKNKQAPPKLRFEWGKLIVVGVVDSITIDLDLFAADGAPLRAKVGLSIKEQDKQYEFLKSGPGANNKPASSLPGQSGPGGLGVSGGLSAGISGGFSAGISAGFSAGISAGVSAGFSADLSASLSADFSATALAGESGAEFAARVGVDPAAWRGLSAQAESSLSFEAGLEVGFSADLSAATGLGVSAGIEAGVSASLEASFGLEIGAGVNAVTGVGANAGLAAGFALSAAGGLTAAIDAVQIARANSAQQQARSAFKLAPAAAALAAKPAAPEQPRPPLTAGGFPSAVAPQSAPSAPPLPRVDARAASFAFGVPLRPSLGPAANTRAMALNGSVPLRPKASQGAPPESRNPAIPRWVSLPARAISCRDRQTQPRQPQSGKCRCGCQCGCKH